jgi:hypothetical protein
MPGNYYASQSIFITAADYVDVIGRNYTFPTSPGQLFGFAVSASLDTGVVVSMHSTVTNGSVLYVPAGRDFVTQGITWTSLFEANRPFSILCDGPTVTNTRIIDTMVSGSGGNGGAIAQFAAGTVFISDFVAPRGGAVGHINLIDAQGTIRNVYGRTLGLVSGTCTGTITSISSLLTISGYAENVMGHGSGTNVGPAALVTGDVMNFRTTGVHREFETHTGTIYNYINTEAGFSQCDFGGDIIKGSMSRWGAYEQSLKQSISSSANIRNLECGDFIQYGVIQEGAQIINVTAKNTGGTGNFDRFTKRDSGIQPVTANRGTFLDCHFNGSSCPAIRVGQNAEVWGGTYLVDGVSDYAIKPQLFPVSSSTKTAGEGFVINFETYYDHGLRNSDIVGIEVMDFDANLDDVSGDSYDGFYSASQLDYQASGSNSIVVSNPSIGTTEIMPASGSHTGTYQQRVKFYVSASIKNAITDGLGIDPDIHLL